MIYHTTRGHNLGDSLVITGEEIAGFVKVNAHYLLGGRKQKCPPLDRNVRRLRSVPAVF
jgi:hypothetical protein